ncbi:MAG: GTA-gp10 family protein [Sphingomonadaceae bacterium]
MRGEVMLEAGTLRLPLRPTFAALVAAEQEVGSLVLLMRRVADGDVRLADAGPLLWHCAVASGEVRVGRDAFEAKLAEAGVQALLPAYRGLLARIFAGG